MSLPDTSPDTDVEHTCCICQESMLPCRQMDPRSPRSLRSGIQQRQDWLGSFNCAGDESIIESESGMPTPDTRQQRVETLGCGHSFHAKCLAPWLQMKRNCPICKQSVEAVAPQFSDMLHIGTYHQSEFGSGSMIDTNYVLSSRNGAQYPSHEEYDRSYNSSSMALNARSHFANMGWNI